MTARRVVLWRHGETDWNASGRYQGHHDVPLNAVGRAQAVAAAPHLAALRPTQLWSSDLSRAVETAGALSAVTGLTVRTDARLQEINVGDWVGLTNAEAFALDPAFEVALREGRDHRRSRTGETATQTGTRVAGALRDLAEAGGDDDVLVVTTHGLATRMAVANLLGLDYASSQVLGRPRNCSWTILEPPRPDSGGDAAHPASRPRDAAHSARWRGDAAHLAGRPKDAARWTLHSFNIVAPSG